MRSRLVMSLALASSTAGAEPSDGYLGFDLTARSGGMGTPLLGASTGGGLETGFRLTGPLWAHGGLTGSSIHDLEDSGDGHVFELHAGVELRGCRKPTVCLTTGLDLGLARANWGNFDSPTMAAGTALDVFAVPRIAFDVGGDVRLRGAFETPIGVGRGTDVTGGHEWTPVVALAVTLGFVVQL